MKKLKKKYKILLTNMLHNLVAIASKCNDWIVVLDKSCLDHKKWKFLLMIES